MLLKTFILLPTGTSATCSKQGTEQRTVCPGDGAGSAETLRRWSPHQPWQQDDSPSMRMSKDVVIADCSGRNSREIISQAGEVIIFATIIWKIFELMVYTWLKLRACLHLSIYAREVVNSPFNCYYLLGHALQVLQIEQTWHVNTCFL